VTGITEMLVQSHEGSIHLLPALPDAWPLGEVSGLCAAGGFEITSLKWKSGKLAQVSIGPKSGGNLRLRVPSNVSLEYKGARLQAATGEILIRFTLLTIQQRQQFPQKLYLKILPITGTTLYDLSTQASKIYNLVTDD
jgi:alpha-L-fucosidase 2